MSYSAIVPALDSIYNESHKSEALGLCKILSKASTLYYIYLLDEILPQTAKLSKTLQVVHLDLSAISAEIADRSRCTTCNVLLNYLLE